MLNIRRLTIILLLILAALFSMWLAMINGHNNNSKGPEVPDTFMTNVNAMKLNLAGKPHYIFTTPQLLTYQTNNRTVANKPFFVFYKPGEPPWQMRADSSQGIDGKNKVILEGNVYIHQLPGVNSNNITLTTNKIIGYPPKSLAETDQPVVITQPGTIINAIGMQADLNKHTIKLLSNTRIQHGTPPKGDWSIVTSDSASVNYKTRIGIFNGHVKAKDKDSNLTADKVYVYRNKQRQITKIIAYGKLARYRTITSPDKPPLNAVAEIIKYFPPKHEVVFMKQAFARQGADTIKAPIIYYNTLQRVMHSTSNNHEQTHIMIDDEGNSNVN